MSERPRKRFPCQDPALIKSRREIGQLEETIHKQAELVEKLQKRIDHLERENGKLEEELKALRRPPEWVKPNKTEEGKRRRKKKGPKYGHKANVRKKPEQVDREVNIIPKQCPCCGEKLPKPHKWHDHDQIDIPPPPKPIVTRYHVGWSWCKHCGKEVSANEKLSGSLYGPILHSLVSYWKFSLGLTFGKIRGFLKEQYDLWISRGQLSELVSRSASEFNGAYEDLRRSLLDQPHLYADETGWRKDGENWWLWSFSNEELSYYVLEKSRGSPVVKKALGDSYQGILSSDFYSAYNSIECEGKQKCWAHPLRELRELKGKYPCDREIERYARQWQRFYGRSIILKEAFENGTDIEKRLQKLVGDTERFLFSRHKHPELKRLSKRLIKHRNELYTFIKTGMDGTNNHAEREIRPAVLMRKISYGNRSDQGAKNQAILMSMIRTAQKRDIDFVPFAASYLVKRDSAHGPLQKTPPN